MSKLLLVEDEPRMREVIKMLLSDLPLTIFEAGDGQEALEIFSSETVQMVITDLKLPKIGGMQVLKTIKEQRPDVPVVVVTAFGSIDNAVEAIHEGAYDYVTKPFTEDKLRSCVEKALQVSRLTSEVRYLRKEIAGKYTFDNIIGNSGEICEILRLAGEVSKTDTTVLLRGESGTGKELLSRATHLNSPRAALPFLPVNCAAIPATLLEAELFGYEKGAFTGAAQQKKGKFEIASGGTLFLDEIGDMELDVQSKFLRVLESKNIERLGGTRIIPTDVRIIAATNKDLEAMVTEGSFREDLYYRLSVFPIHIPPLRERRDDIEPLCNYFIKEFSEAFGRRPPVFSDKVLELFQSHPWNGNIRELRNVLERAMILSKGDRITTAHVILSGGPVAKPVDNMGAQQMVEQLVRRHRVGLEELEKRYIQFAMEESGHNVSRAARLLNLSRATLRYRLDKMDEK
ncbi:sigma-54-dependent Fis family transcriptional regulator [Desulforhopalus vacuolatus]|uniref:sigma-54-dependent transcriptional regulator n=1 Tax=Desulforhopalus vacuolatus TaxID=40414 RepID=UPI001964A004|nr:sigma-54 dependent transcriptional regulator [Desulforhopalus vacuolatus]MBM9519663.1 sigma-54-dependent Fis family transcriptional regulator [Desulforhopalus vacuolatus]